MLYIKHIKKPWWKNFWTAFIVVITVTYCIVFTIGVTSGHKEYAKTCEYLAILWHICVDSYFTFMWYPGMTVSEMEETFVPNAEYVSTVHQLDFGVLAPLGIMYLSSVVSFYVKDPAALASWQIPHFVTLVAGSHVPHVEVSCWAFSAFLSLVGRATPPQGHQRVQVLHWVVPFMAAWVAVLSKSQLHEVGSSGDVDFHLSCAALVGVALMLATRSPQVFHTNPAVLTIACISVWCSVKVLGDTIAPDAWLTSAAWRLGQHALLLGLLLLNSAMPPKVSQHGDCQSLADTELAEVILA